MSCRDAGFPRWWAQWTGDRLAPKHPGDGVDVSRVAGVAGRLPDAGIDRDTAGHHRAHRRLQAAGRAATAAGHARRRPDDGQRLRHGPHADAAAASAGARRPAGGAHRRRLGGRAHEAQAPAGRRWLHRRAGQRRQRGADRAGNPSRDRRAHHRLGDAQQGRLRADRRRARQPGHRGPARHRHHWPRRAAWPRRPDRRRLRHLQEALERPRAAQAR
ncbi:unnamed protein product [Rotaria sp. Silwood1]|nr:unnamed protein product [Rotaria sp. Silwood1]